MIFVCVCVCVCVRACVRACVCACMHVHFDRMIWKVVAHRFINVSAQFVELFQSSVPVLYQDSAGETAPASAHQTGMAGGSLKRRHRYNR